MKTDAFISCLKQLAASPAILEYIGRSFQMVSSGGFIALIFQDLQDQILYFPFCMVLLGFGLIFHYLADSIRKGEKS